MSADGDTVIVSAEWLQANLGAPRIRIVDVRGKVLPPGQVPRYLPKREEYEASHIPGAVFVDWTRDIVDAADPVPVQIAKADAFAAKMGELGIGDDTLVVAYDDYRHIFAGRLAWALRYYGHDGVRVLDGGFATWLAEGRPTSREEVRPPQADAAVAAMRAIFTARTRPSLRRTADDVAAAIGKGEVLLLDARPPDQYEGLSSAAARAGHIPGARNVHYARLVDAMTGKFLPKEELARAFVESGVDVANLPREVVVYCNGGISCTVPLQALELLGRRDVAIYDGSWNEWGNDPLRPIVKGSRP